MSIDEALQGLKKKAIEDAALRAALLATSDSETPVADFCKVATDAGFPIYQMDLINASEDYYAAMRRSTNGGGENSPLLDGEDDYYEMFLGELRSL